MSTPVLWISKTNTPGDIRDDVVPGFNIVHAPLLSVKRTWLSPARPKINDVLAFSSANALRMYAATHTKRDGTIYVVGSATKACAHASGFASVRSANGNIEALFKLIMGYETPKTARIYYACAAQVSGDLPAKLREKSFAVTRAVFYRTHGIKTVPASVRETLDAQRQLYVFLYSPKGAQTFARLNLPFDTISTFSISANVDAKLEGLNLRQRKIAKYPTHSAMLSLL